METKRLEIINWLTGPRDFADGVALYGRYGVNLRLKRELNSDGSSVMREILADELRKIAGLSDAEFRRLPRLARKAVALDCEEAVKQGGEEAAVQKPKYEEAPEHAKKWIRFRQRFQFLNDLECPDVLKVLVSDMFTAYSNYQKAYSDLSELGDKDASEAFALCGDVVDNYLSNREIWDELEHYRKFGTILGKAAIFREADRAEELDALSEMDLMSRFRSATANVSKRSAALKNLRKSGASEEKVAKAEEALAGWVSKKEELKAEVERRKKK